jgi:DNA-binding NarL/FixJ family response regulator
MTRVLLVDDHPVVRAGLRRMLEHANDFTVGGEAGTWRDALRLNQAEHWDLVVLDMFLPDADGLEALKQLKAFWPTRPVLILTLRAEGEIAVRALKAGAAGFIGKDSPATAIIDAARRAAAGRVVVNDWVGEQLARRVSESGDLPLHAKLSDREFQVLLRLATGRAVKQIAAELSLSVKTISTYRARILDKLQVFTNAELARYALRHELID